MNTVFMKIVFEMKMWWLDWKYYTFHPLSRGSIYPPSFYLRYTSKEREQILRKQIEKLTEMLKEFDERNGITYPNDKSALPPFLKNLEK